MNVTLRAVDDLWAAQRNAEELNDANAEWEGHSIDGWRNAVIVSCRRGRYFEERSKAIRERWGRLDLCPEGPPQSPEALQRLALNVQHGQCDLLRDLVGATESQDDKMEDVSLSFSFLG